MRRLGPGTLCCSVAKLALGHTSPGATKYKETVGLKTTACMCSWGKFWPQKIQEIKKKKKTAILEEPGGKTGCWEQKQGIEQAPLADITSEVSKAPKPPLWPDQ